MTDQTVQKQINRLERQLADARARMPEHDPSPALMAEIDELEEKLEALQAQAARPRSVTEQIAELEARLKNARARIPKHSSPPALMVEIDELEEELIRLQALEKGGK